MEVTEQAETQDPFQVSKGVVPGAWTMLVYGIPGVGKSTLGTYAPSPFFLDLENGLKTIDCTKTKTRLTSLDEVISWLRWFIKKPEYKTVVVDTVDELEKYFAARAVANYNREVSKPVKTVADIPYGRGGDLLVAEWRAFIDILDHVANAGKNVLLTGHEQIVKFENPSDANFDYYTVNLHKKAAAVLTAKMDAVLFARFETFVKDKVGGKGKAGTNGARIVHTSQGASWVAKNRFNLPESLPLDGSIFQKIAGKEP